MSILFEYVSDNQGNQSAALALSDLIKSARVVTLSTSQITVPSDYDNWVVLFNYGVDAEFWVAVNNTAVAPVSPTFADGDSVLNPLGLKVKAGDVIEVYNNGANTASICASLYALS